jgi:CheY-like chemotaxis protein
VTDAGQLQVLICDDAIAFPRLVELWLGNGDGVASVGAVTSASELLESLAADAPDVLLLDFMLPDGPVTPDLVTTLRERARAMRIVLVSNLPQEALEEAAANLRVDACCSKATTPEGLLAAVRGA